MTLALKFDIMLRMENLELDKYINDKELNRLADFLLDIKNPIYVNGHINTDYDSICSGVLLAYLLNSVGKKATMLFSFDAKILYDRVKQDDYDDFISTTFSAPKTDYTGILVDMNSTYRASFEDMFLNAQTKINIDHHDNNKMECDIKYVDENAGANCENILKLAIILEKKTGKKLINSYFCKLLSMGIITDTSNIVKSTNLEQTEWAINIIKSFDVDTDEIANLVYLNLNNEQLEIFEKTIDSKKVYDYISYYFIEENNLKNDVIHNDYAMVLSRIIKIDSNPIVLYEQRKDNESIWEFRSNDIKKFPVNEIALMLGGGGHKNASGATITDKSPKQVVEAFLKYYKNRK